MGDTDKDWKVSWTDADQVLKHASLDRDDAAAGMTPQAYAAALAEDGREADALTFTVHALAPLLAIRFAIQCAGECDLNDEAGLALAAAIDWTQNPNEPARRNALRAAETAGLSDAGSFAALAVFWSGAGSIGPEDAAPVLPAAGLCGRAAVAASSLARSGSAPDTFEADLRRHLDWADAYARGAAPQSARP